MSFAWTRSRLPRASFASRKRTGRRSRRTVRGSPQPLPGSCLCRRRLEAAVRSACLLSACSRERLRPRVPPRPRRQPSPAISLFRRSSRRCARHSGRHPPLPRSPSRRPVSPSLGHCPLRSSGAASNASVFRWSSNASVLRWSARGRSRNVAYCSIAFRWWSVTWTYSIWICCLWHSEPFGPSFRIRANSCYPRYPDLQGRIGPESLDRVGLE